MFLSHHTIITILVYLLVVPKDNIFIFLPFFIGGVLIDLDHCVDYYLRYKKPTFSHRELSDGLADRHHYILPLHTYEFMLLCIGIGILITNQYFFYFGLGYFIHMILDVTFNHYDGFWSMSLIYRLTHWWGIVCSNMG